MHLLTPAPGLGPDPRFQWRSALYIDVDPHGLIRAIAWRSACSVLFFAKVVYHFPLYQFTIKRKRVRAFCLTLTLTPPSPINFQCCLPGVGDPGEEVCEGRKSRDLFGRRAAAAA